MASLDKDLKDAFTKISRGAEVAEVHQGSILEVMKQLGLKEADRSGICWELCRRWVQRVLEVQGSPLRPGDSVYEIIMGKPLDESDIFPKPDQDYMKKLIAEHASTNRSDVAGNFNVAGATKGASIERTRSCFRFTVLRDREAVIEHIYKNPGCFIFVFEQRTGGGHASAFALGDGRLLFFDPNMGEFHVPADSAGTRKGFLDWYKSYWGRYYKAGYTKGDRVLTRYTAS